MWLLNYLWNLTYSKCFCLCSAKVMIGPAMLVTSNMAGNALLSICRCKTHDPRLYTDCPPYVKFVPWVYFKFLVIPDHIVAEPCGVGRMLQQLLCWFHSQSEGFEIPETELPIVVLCALCLCCACSDFCHSLEALELIHLLDHCGVVRSCVLTLGIVWRLFFCVYVLDLSLVTVLVIWSLFCTSLRSVLVSIVEAFLTWSFALWSVFVKLWAREFTCSLSTYACSLVLRARPLLNHPCDWTCHPEAIPTSLLGILGFFVHRCTVCAVWKLWT